MEYNPVSNTTYCSIYGSDSDIPRSIHFAFPGSGTGTFNWEGILKGSFIEITLTSSPDLYQLISTDHGSTTIKTYGNSGEIISGNFAGDFILRRSYDKVNVTGEFSIYRLK